MTSREVVSSSTRYEGEHLLLEYDKGDITLYDLPAGGKENDEDPLSGMMRELKEETGLNFLDVENLTALRPYTYSLDDSTFYVHPFDIELKGRRDSLDLDRSEHDSYSWLSDEEIEQAGRDGWLNSPKFFNAMYVEASRNGLGELRGTGQEPLSFTDEEVMENLDDLEALINSRVN